VRGLIAAMLDLLTADISQPSPMPAMGNVNKVFDCGMKIVFFSLFILFMVLIILIDANSWWYTLGHKLYWEWPPLVAPCMWPPGRKTTAVRAAIWAATNSSAAQSTVSSKAAKGVVSLAAGNGEKVG